MKNLVLFAWIYQSTARYPLATVVGWQRTALETVS